VIGRLCCHVTGFGAFQLPGPPGPPGATVSGPFGFIWFMRSSLLVLATFQLDHVTFMLHRLVSNVHPSS
jgi:hypothetical protein